MIEFFFVAEKTALAAVAQSVERRIGNAEVTGPIPVSSLLLEPVDCGFFFFCRPGWTAFFMAHRRRRRR